MSGEIFQPMDSIAEDLEQGKWNPLLCFLCGQQYQEPAILACFHSFCSNCLRGRASNNTMTCPLCGAVTTLREGSSLPPADLLLKFMVESSMEEKASCANCDLQKDDMWFCNTCSQPLCNACREETHRPRMFSAHDVVRLSKRTKDIHKKCTLHGEPYIMFSNEKKIMLCINCFRDMRIESRTHCVDLETAYNQSHKKLDQSVLAIHDLQSSVKEGILLFRALLEEIKRNADKERTAITTLFDNMMERIANTKNALLGEVDKQFQEKEALYKEQLRSLTSVLPTLKVHLVTSGAFSSSANKFEFLDLAYVLMERLKSIVQRQHPLHPTQGSQVDTDHKAAFARALEPLLAGWRTARGNNHLAGMTDANGVCQKNGPQSLKHPLDAVPIVKLALSKSATVPSCPAQTFKMATNGRRGNLNGTKIKFIDAKGPFADHCVEFESSHRELLQRMERLKTGVQELQRDLTLRRCLTRSATLQELQALLGQMESQLQQHARLLQLKQPALEKHWEECLQRVSNEQELYQAQLQDVERLKNESLHMQSITAQLSSFVTSIAAVTQRLAPKLSSSSHDAEHENQIQCLLEEINAVHPDSQQRVDAIRTAEEERQTATANRTNPLDSELIKTKGLLRAPSARKTREEREREKERDKAGEKGKDAKEVRGEEVVLVNGEEKVKAEETVTLVVSVLNGELENGVVEKQAGGKEEEAEEEEEVQTANLPGPPVCQSSQPSSSPIAVLVESLPASPKSAEAALAVLQTSPSLSPSSLSSPSMPPSSLPPTSLSSPSLSSPSSSPTSLSPGTAGVRKLSGSSSPTASRETGRRRRRNVEAQQ